MNVDTLFQSFKLGEKQIIIQGLSELIDFLSQGAKAQEEVIQFLPENNLMMIMDYLADPDAYLRRLAAKFLLDLVHDNYLVQLVFCDILGVIPCDGKICLNSVPDPFKNVAKYVPECLETLKQSAVEEKNDQLPYCWYLHVQNADKPDKRITFISSSDKESLIDHNEQFDPLYAIVGFVMRCPKKESNSKILKSKLSEIVKPITTQASIELGSLNMSLDQSGLQKALPDGQKVNASISVSLKRKPMSKSPIVGLPNISSRIANKPTVNLTMMTPTSSQLKNEKEHNKSTLVGSESPAEPGSATSEKKVVTRVVFKKMAEDRKIGTRKTEPTIELYDGAQQAIKLSSSIHEVNLNLNDNETKMTTLENSLNNSLVVKGKSTAATPSATPSVSAKAKAQTGKTTKPGVDKTQTHRDKELSSILTTDEMSISQYNKQKSTDLDKKPLLKTPKGTASSISSSNRGVPNTTLLNKILKAKPGPTKEKSHTLSQSIHQTRTDQNKGSFWDFIYAYRKINANTLSSVISTTNKPAKTSTSNMAKKQQQEQEPKSSSTSTTHIRKRAIHTSLIQHTVEPNSSLSNRYEALDDELSLDATPKTALSSRKNTIPLKTYHVSESFQNPVVSSRASQEGRKDSVTTFGKFLSPRKSHDVTYLTNQKKKADSSVTVQDQKNKKTQQKKVNQTVVQESIQVK